MSLAASAAGFLSLDATDASARGRPEPRVAKVYVPSCWTGPIVTPPIALDPGLLASGPAVATVQTHLGLPADGVFGASTAAAIPATVTGTICSPSYVVQAPVVDALTALAASTDQLTADAQARIEAARVAAVEAQRRVAPAPRVAATPVPVSGDCFGVNWMAADIYMHESGCNPGSVNSGGCAGIGQACPGSKLPCSLSDAPCQLAYFESYAMSRYGSWEAAYAFRNANNWW